MNGFQVAAIVLTSFLLVVSLRNWRVAVWCIVIPPLVALSYFGIGATEQLGFPVQLLAGPSIGFLLTKRLGERAAGRTPLRPMLALLLIGALSVGWSQDAGNTIGGVIGLLYLTLGVLALSSAPDRAYVTHAFVVAFGLTLAGSVLVVRLPFAFQQGQFRGLLENANGLGSIAFMWAVLASRRVSWLIVTPIATAIILSAGARGSLIALLLALPWLVRLPVTSQIRALLGGVYLVALSAATLAALYGPSAASAADGTVNTRAEVWSMAWTQFLASPIIGSGLASVEIVGSSYLQLARDVGVVGVVLLAVILRRSWATLENAPRYARGFFVACLGAAFFESWLLSGGTVLAYAFWFEAIHRAWSNDSPRRQVEPASVIVARP